MGFGLQGWFLFLAPGPGIMKAEGYCFLRYKGQIEELWLWISLHIKGVFLAEFFALSKNWLAQRGMVFS